MGEYEKTWLVLYKPDTGYMWRGGSIVKGNTVQEAYKSCLMAMFGVETGGMTGEEAAEELLEHLESIRLYPVQVKNDGGVVFSTPEKLLED